MKVTDIFMDNFSESMSVAGRVTVSTRGFVLRVRLQATADVNVWGREAGNKS